MNANDRAKIAAIRDRWSDWAFLLQELYGQDDPTCIAIRKCISDLYPLEAEPSEWVLPPKTPPTESGNIE